jgi:hypothetical protein
MSHMKSKRLLQAAVSLLGLIPVTVGLYGVIFGPEVLLATVPPTIDLDSHFRYLSGIFVGVGLTFYATVIGIERKTTLFRLAAFLVAIGGLARLASLLSVGTPSTGHLIGLGLELVVVPLLALWQGRVAAAYAGPRWLAAQSK